jgi:type II secretory pathway pseudopilin PulG
LVGTKGFSLIEIMVGVGLMSVVGLGVMQIMKESGRVSKGTIERIQMEEVMNRVDRLFRDAEICRSTLFGKNPNGSGENISEIIKKENILDIKVFEGATTTIDSSEITEYQAKRIQQTYIRADCPNSVGDASVPCVFGKGSRGRIFLKSMRVMAYEMTHSSSSSPTSPYRNQDSYATIEMVFLRGSAIGKSTPKAIQKAQETTYGAVEVTKRITLSVELDRSGSGGLIANCNTQLETFTKGACYQFGGVIDFDEKCKNIQVQAIAPDPPLLGPPNIAAITVDGDLQVKRNLIVVNTLDVGSKGDNASGNVNASGTVTIGEALQLTEGDLNIKDKVTLSSTANGEVSFFKNSGDNKALLKLGSSTWLRGMNDKIGLMVAGDPTVNLDVEGDGHMRETLEVDGNLNVLEDLEMGGVATYRIVGGTLELTGVEFELDNGVNDSYSSVQSSSENDLIAKRKWVYEMFRDRLGDRTTIDQVINELLSYSGSNQLRQVQHALCKGIRNASWTGSQCRLFAQNSLCPRGQILRGFNAGNKVCNTPNFGNFNIGPSHLLTGFTTGGARTKTIENVITPETNRIADRQEGCFSRNRAANNMYNVIYDIFPEQCVASTFFREFRFGGCGHAAGNDSARDCNCARRFGAEWYYTGHFGCQYNWLVWGFKCQCARDL